MAIEAINGPAGVEQASPLPRDEQQAAVPEDNTADTDLEATDIVTISPEGQNINNRTSDNPNTPPENAATTSPERGVEQRIQENQDNLDRESSQPPQRADNVDEVV